MKKEHSKHPEVPIGRDFRGYDDIAKSLHLALQGSFLIFNGNRP